MKKAHPGVIKCWCSLIVHAQKPVLEDTVGKLKDFDRSSVSKRLFSCMRMFVNDARRTNGCHDSFHLCGFDPSPVCTIGGIGLLFSGPFHFGLKKMSVNVCFKNVK
ncbi:hypothetical protein CEXT_234681 [Caerostris extrusa]|uniref:Uncharacterized protein n=1 Tax=Caerostris extrusa TaxID=172846 RepID=A0AAV4PI81_CAEEX|nr:hypothetical protein CEXT_234681 [Caerostris extrusa]